MNFWDYDSWSFIIQIGIILVSIMCANAIRRKVKFIRNSLLPSSVVAGIIVFSLMFVPKIGNFINHDFMEILTYHCLGLGFIALALKTGTKSKDSNKKIILFSGITTVNGYLIQAIVGLGLTLLFSFTIFKDLFYAAGLLLPMGFGQGTGQALNIGGIFQDANGFEAGRTFGLAVAAIGFLVACLVGVLYMNILKRKGKLDIHQSRKEVSNALNSDIYAPDEAPLSEAVDKLTMQFGFVLLVYLICLFTMWGLSTLSIKYLGNFGKNTLRPLIWGFNFLFGSIFSIVIKKIINYLRKSNIMTHTYINDYMMSRLSGFFFDIMIVAGIAAIKWDSLEGLLWPLLIICAVGGAATFIYIKFICKKIYPNYEHEAFFSIFGMLTGTASTGMILLREIDPNYETPAADNLVLQQMPAIIFGAPLLLLIPFAGKSVQNSIIMMGLIVLMFVLYNLIVLWNSLFKTKFKK